MAAMADFHGGLSKKRHRIAVAWRVKDGGAMAAMADVAARRKMADAAATLDLEAPTQRDNPRPRNHPHLQPATTHGGDEHGSDHPRQRERRRRARRERRQRERRRRPSQNRDLYWWGGPKPFFLFLLLNTLFCCLQLFFSVFLFDTPLLLSTVPFSFLFLFLS